jgi:glutathione S-transferase
LIQGSDRILDWSGTPGGDPGLEHRFERRIGPLVRQYLYSTALADPRSGVRDLLLDGVPERQARIGAARVAVDAPAHDGRHERAPGVAPKLAVDLAAEIDWFERETRRPPLLVGDQLGRADITAASLLAPLARPPELPLYRRTQFSAEVEATIAQWRARPALRWVERIYAQHRR